MHMNNFSILCLINVKDLIPVNVSNLNQVVGDDLNQLDIVNSGDNIVNDLDQVDIGDLGELDVNDLSMLNIRDVVQIDFSFNSRCHVDQVVSAVDEISLNNCLVKMIIEGINDASVVAYCGEKNAPGNGQRDYQRAKVINRDIKTSLGEINCKMNGIKNTSQVDNEIFYPLDEKIEIDKNKNFQNEISFKCAESASKMTYRDTVKVIKNFISTKISTMTIQRSVKYYGKQLKEFYQKHIKEKYKDEKINVMQADSTKGATQDHNKKQNNMAVAIGIDNNGQSVLLDHGVNKSWSIINDEIKELDAISKNGCLVADGEKSIRNSLVNDNMHFQYDTIHFPRELGFNLWIDDINDKKEKKEIINELTSILYHQINATEKYRNDEKKLKESINKRTKELKSLSNKLKEKGYKKAANFVRTYSNYAFTYSALILEGIEVPWNSNIIERSMGEIQKRCKHKWMRWSTEGLDGMLSFILIQYFAPEIYQKLVVSKSCLF
jgi:23S rRNA pseudoU1915 N3-methylase RlmH